MNLKANEVFLVGAMTAMGGEIVAYVVSPLLGGAMIGVALLVAHYAGWKSRGPQA